MKVFGRDPAVIIAVLASLLQLAGARLFHLTPEVQGVVVAFVTAGFGVWTALYLAKDKALPAILGFVQAGFSLYIAFGQDLSAVDQANFLGLVTVLVGLYVRPQVTAKVAADGTKVG